MLKYRLITAVVLLPLVIWLIFWGQTTLLAVVMGLLIMQGAWEWSRLMQLRTTVLRVIYVLLVVVSLAGAWSLFVYGGTGWLSLPVLSLFWWLMAAIWVITYPDSQKRWSSPLAMGIIGLFVLVPTWLSVLGLHAYGPEGAYLLFYLLSLIWVADSGAYFGGRSWGKRKLAPAVSPGKTWEGVYSAVGATAVYAVLAAWFFEISGNRAVLFVVLSLITVAFSVLGDLGESMFKRHAGVKDSGRLLPGHGGVLDRIDSVTAAAPVFLLGLWLGEFDFAGAGS